MSRHTYQYTVRYRRAGWKSGQVRRFQSLPPARRLVRKLMEQGWGYGHLAPIVELRIERRPLGPVEVVEEVL